MPSALADKVAKVEALAKQVKDKETLAPGTPTPEAVLGGAPAVRIGENSMGSRGFSLLKMVRAQVNKDWSGAKVEFDIHQKLRAGFGAGFGGKASFEGGTLAPFSSEFMPDNQLGAEVKALMYGGIEGFDPEELAHASSKMKLGNIPGWNRKASVQSWLDQTLGGALVGPPGFGEPIELWRNRDALVRAGATVGPMPASGRFVAPRQTTASTAYWTGESAAGTTTNVKTGQITWTAKKLMALLIYSREILEFGGAAAEMLFRMDLTRSLVLTADQAMLEGGGADIKPLGLINTPNIGTVTPTTAASGATGAILAPGDLYSFFSTVEENNIPDEAGCSFVMRPNMYYALLKRRVDAVTAADGAGLFTFSPFRELGSDLNAVKSIGGQRVITTTQVSKTRFATGTSGATQTYIIYGYWPDYMILMAPLMEFVVATQGNPANVSNGDLFAQDQFALKGIMFLDGAARHPAGFAWCDSLQQV